MADHDRDTRTDPLGSGAEAPIPDRPSDDASTHEDEREDRAATEFGGAYGEDETAMPTETAATLGNPPRGEARYETQFTRPEGDDQNEDVDEGPDRDKRGS